MILGHNEIRRRLLDGDLVIKPLNNDTVRESGVDLRLYETVRFKPREFKVAWTKEYIEFPVDLAGFCNLRSTYARQGLLIPPTVVDAGFKGHLVIEVYNANNYETILKKDTRFLHLILIECKGAKPYQGRYQYQHPK